MSHLSTHVLDTTHGRPAAGIAVTLTDAAGSVVAVGTTDEDGRVGDLGPDLLPPGAWTLTFATGEHWARLGLPVFHPRVDVTFVVPESPAGHYHVPLLISPFAYSTYRGS
ncbi:hydroxyisourate hydrolase [Curtobacterium sp. MCBD17_035]|uniref:hydroxyisourate hydrolase n=1 Tax=Curtobacterium sp. MCBD17_035 TaxID=2175673 RepID=UPI000DA8F4CA|nr:hydroxyisourate hydrolase [Curtobacterium sp. MCBD17_035]WIB68969.1 hydroxyisourate hydrolase [Curtobacterium sp. MCBD17_035]